MYDSTVNGGEEDRSVPTLQPELCCMDIAAAGEEDEENLTQYFFQPWMMPLVPEVSPLPWMIINNAFAVSGCLLIVDMWYTNNDYGDPAEKGPFATALYLCWEFSICVFWTLETGLSASYQHFYLREPLKWYTQLEMALAVYFVWFTCRMLWQWDLEYEANKIWEVVFDTSFYVYLAVRSCQRISTPSELLPNHANQPDISSSTLEAPGEGEELGSYRTMAKDVRTSNNTGAARPEMRNHLLSRWAASTIR